MCETCKGSGEVIVAQGSLLYPEPDTAACPDCDGVDRRPKPPEDNPWVDRPINEAPLHACAGLTCQVCHRTAAQQANTAISTVDANAASEWLRVAAYIIHRFAESGRTFSSDEIMLELESTSVQTHDPRALGPVIRRAIKAGEIVEVGMTRSRRRHGARIPVYQGARMRVA